MTVKVEAASLIDLLENFMMNEQIGFILYAICLHFF